MKGSLLRAHEERIARSMLCVLVLGITIAAFFMPWLRVTHTYLLGETLAEDGQVTVECYPWKAQSTVASVAEGFWGVKRSVN